MKQSEIVLILQVAISPVILISGVGLLILSMTNRFGRIIDRSRLLAHDLRAATSSEERARAQAQIGILSRRARLLRHAILLASFSVLLAAILVIVLFLLALLNLEAASVVVAVLFVACMACLIRSLIYFIRDINLSLAALRLEHGQDADR